MIRAGIRRFAIILGIVTVLTAAGSLLVALLTDRDKVQSLAFGFWIVGAGIIIIALFSAGSAVSQGYEMWETGAEAPVEGGGDTLPLVLLGVLLLLIGVLAHTQAGDGGPDRSEPIAAELSARATRPATVAGHCPRNNRASVGA